MLAFKKKKPSDATSINVYCFQIVLYYLMQIFPNEALIWGGYRNAKRPKLTHPPDFQKYDTNFTISSPVPLNNYIYWHTQ